MNPTPAVQDETLGVTYWEKLMPPSTPRAEVGTRVLAPILRALEHDVLREVQPGVDQSI